ncbi:MAG TPA: hypothetical protein VFE62_01265, partial [Gemmataceae bacterium]|nr:hypothetical protein [Gemmataceae bacterium]
MNNAYWLLFLVLFEMCPGIGGKTSDEKSVVLSAKEIHRFQAGGSGAFYDVGFSRNGAFLGAGSHKGKVVVWDMAKGSEILGIEAGKKVT